MSRCSKCSKCDLGDCEFLHRKEMERASRKPHHISFTMIKIDTVICGPVGK